MQNSKHMDKDDNDFEEFGADAPGTTYSADQEPGAYPGWILYFPNKPFTESHDIVRRIRAMEVHFDSFSNWYQSDISHTCLLTLNLTNLEEDKVLAGAWPEFFEELVQEPTQTLACTALAMHNIIVKANIGQGPALYQQQKIYTRPIGHNPIINICDAHQTSGIMVSVRGLVVSVNAPEVKVKMLCFRCSLCSAELVVKQTKHEQNYSLPLSCIKGCKAKSGFIQMFSSPSTIFQLTQMIKLQESAYVENQEHSYLFVEIINTDSIKVGMTITVTGTIEHIREKTKFVKSAENKTLKSYLKCFSVESFEKANGHMTSTPSELNTEFIRNMHTEPSPFRLLVNSLCPLVFGREEIKAGLILSILSGKDLCNVHRSESHVLLIGDPGTGKRKLLQACAEVSVKGIFVSGPTATGPGLTASVGKKGSVDAGALILSNGGVCCIDEFDKMASNIHILLEVAEQQTVSITKYGVNANFDARVNIIAAANPVASYLDNSKTLVENIKIASPMLSRFDLIFKVTGDLRSVPNFLSHISYVAKQDETSSHSKSFFGTPFEMKPEMRKNLKWLYVGENESFQPIEPELMKFYCEYVRENFKPKLSEEAKSALLEYIAEMYTLNLSSQVQPITHRQLEGLVRLTLARARADMCHEATLEHALDVINLMKYSMSDGLPTKPMRFKTSKARKSLHHKQDDPNQRRINDFFKKKEPL